MGLFLECGYVSLNKAGEELCGDKVESFYSGGATTLVLADGLGSGVKANILATLTSKIIGTMMAQGMSITDCVETIASTLPVCNTRNVAYSTFTILQAHKNGEAYLVQFDNPAAIFIQGGKCQEYASVTENINGKKILESYFQIEEGDTFVMFSDGVIHAGVGKLLNFGWQHENVVKFLDDNFDKEFSAKSLAALLADACKDLYMGKPGDDTTIAVMRCRKDSTVSLMLGPPVDPRDDDMVVAEFLACEGRKIVSGGTTSKVVSRYLKQPVETSLEYLDPHLPPTGKLKGVDLVTEGVLTLSRVMEICNSLTKEWENSMLSPNKKDGATLIARMLIEEATDVNFFVGRAKNPAHQNPALPLDLSLKLKIVENLEKTLVALGKRVTVKFY